jgi:hypothetical protein
MLIYAVFKSGGYLGAVSPNWSGFVYVERTDEKVEWRGVFVCLFCLFGIIIGRGWCTYVVLECLQMEGLTCWGSGGRGFGTGEGARAKVGLATQVRAQTC